MNTKKTRTGRVGGTPVTADGLRRLVGDFLSDFAGRLTSVADQMEKTSVNSLEVQHWGTASRGLEAIAKFVADAERAISVQSTTSVRDLFHADGKSRS